MKLPALLALLAPVAAAQGEISAVQTISDIEGGLGAVLVDDDRFGYAVAHIGDVDGDGYPDVAVGAPETQFWGVGGSVWILLLQADGTVKTASQILSTDLAFPGDIHSFGHSVGSMGDFDGDGVPDVIVGGVEQIGLNEYGRVFILNLNSDGTLKSSLQITPGWSSSAYGRSVTGLGDIDGDGTPDAAIGVPDNYSTSKGELFVTLLDPDATEKSSILIGEGSGGFGGDLISGDHFASSLARLSDLDGNGVPELAVGTYHDMDGSSPGAGDQGAIWVVFLDSAGMAIGEQKISDLHGDLGLDLVSGDHMATSLGALDVDQDGIRDLFVGGDNHVWLLILRLDGTVKATLEWDPNHFGLPGGEGFGRGATLLPDLDGDGNPELILSTPTGDAGGDDRGEVHVGFFGGVVTAQVLPHGCDLNPAGSFQTFGQPVLGKTMEFHITNPLGTQNTGTTLPILSLSLDAAGSACGLPVPGWHMNPSQHSGELLTLSTPGLPLLTQPYWQGAPVVFPYDIPPLPVLMGVEAYVQGAMVDILPTAQVPISLTRARKLVFGI